MIAVVKPECAVFWGACVHSGTIGSPSFSFPQGPPKPLHKMERVQITGCRPFPDGKGEGGHLDVVGRAHVTVGVRREDAVDVELTSLRFVSVAGATGPTVGN